MKRRFRWIAIPEMSRVLLSSIANKMLAGQYTAEKGLGYQINKVRPDLIIGSFIEKCEISERVRNPFGEYQQYERTEYRTTSFALRAKGLSLEVQNPGKSCGKFLVQLSDFTDYKITLESVDVDLLSWVREYETEGCIIKVTAIKVSKLPLTAQTAMSISIQGSEDVRSVLEKATRGRNGYITAVVFNTPYFEGKLEINGRATITGTIGDDDIKRLRDSLERAHRTS